MVVYLVGITCIYTLLNGASYAPTCCWERRAIGVQPFTEGRLMMAFDATYLAQSLCQMTVQGERGLVGGCWTLEAPKNAFVSLEKCDVAVGGMPKASLMMHFVVWDPCARKKVVLSVNSVPLDKSFADKSGASRGNYAMLQLVGQVMEQSGGVIMGLCFDSHTSHGWVRRVLQGQLDDLEPGILETVPFFKDLQWKPLPPHNLPRLPIEVAMHQGQPVYPFGGPCDL